LANRVAGRLNENNSWFDVQICATSTLGSSPVEVFISGPSSSVLTTLIDNKLTRRSPLLFGDTSISLRQNGRPYSWSGVPGSNYDKEPKIKFLNRHRLMTVQDRNHRTIYINAATQKHSPNSLLRSTWLQALRLRLGVTWIVDLVNPLLWQLVVKVHLVKHFSISPA